METLKDMMLFITKGGEYLIDENGLLRKSRKKYKFAYYMVVISLLMAYLLLLTNYIHASLDTIIKGLSFEAILFCVGIIIVSNCSITSWESVDPKFVIFMIYLGSIFVGFPGIILYMYFKKREKKYLRLEHLKAINNLKDKMSGLVTTDSLISALKDNNKWVRVVAANYLGRRNNDVEKIVSTLTMALKDEYCRVRIIAAISLRSKTKDATTAIPILIEALNTKNRYLCLAITHTLIELTGKSFTRWIDICQDAQKWRRWWEENQKRLVS